MPSRPPRLRRRTIPPSQTRLTDEPAARTALDTSARAVGRLLAAVFYVVGRLRRRPKALHPRGQILSGTLFRHGLNPPTGARWLDEPGEDEVLVRLSRAIGLPLGWPDILGLAMRIHQSDGYGDLLLATTGTGRFTRYLLRPTGAEPTRNRYTTFLPYRTLRGPVQLAAFPLSSEMFELRCASLTGPWRPFGELQVTREPTGDEPEPLVSFDPLINQLPGLAPYKWHRELREYAYAAARRARARRGGRN